MPTLRAHRLAPALAGLLATLLGTAVALVGVPASAAVFVPDRPAVTWRVNGTVYATEIVGNTLIVGGSFSAALSSSGTTVPRANLAAFSVSSGALLTGWRAGTNGVVRALRAETANVWVGGDFTMIDGKTRHDLAKVTVAGGQVASGFAPRLTGTRSGVRAILVTGSVMWAGGTFTGVNGSTAFPRLVKLNSATGSILRGFTGTPSGQVWSLARRPNGRIYVGGPFDRVNRLARAGLAAMDPITGRVLGPRFAGRSTQALALQVSDNGTRVYAGLRTNECASFRTDNGARTWAIKADGNMQAVKVFAGHVYCGFHDGFAGNTRLKALAVSATGRVDPDWRPQINSFWGVHAIDASTAGLVLGGAFTTVSGVRARGFAIFRS